MKMEVKIFVKLIKRVISYTTYITNESTILELELILEKRIIE